MRKLTILLSMFAVASSFAADSPYAGKWKINLDKSDYSQTTVTYESLPGGEWRCTFGGYAFKFKMDGKDYPDGVGDTDAWTTLGPNAWQTTWKLNGKTISTDTVNIASDGSLIFVSKGTKPNGDPIDDSTVYQRVSGGPGLAGKWKTKAVKSNSTGVLEFAPSGADGLSFKQPAERLVCDAKMDGKDYPCSGPTLPPGWTIAMAKTGARSMDLTIKKDGKPFSKMTYTVAQDGRSMTATGGAVATNEKIRRVFDKQ